MHKATTRVLLLFGAALWIVTQPTSGAGQTIGSARQPMTTEEHLRSGGWWATKGSPTRDEYLGPAVCAECHSSQALVQGLTPMAAACARATDSKILQAHDRLSLHLDRYAYEIVHAGSSSIYSVSDGGRSIAATLGWTFGNGQFGETYVFTQKGIFYESQVSYFSSLHGLDITPGHPHSVPSDLEGALGRPLDAKEIQRCFGCHNTASATNGKFDPDHLISGVTCEACHGPGAKHVAAIKRGRPAEGSSLILNPAKLDPVDSVDFCGACHRTLADVMEAGAQGISTVRFEPYGLEISRCWGKGDRRLTCVACHNPHQPVIHAPAFYDTRCLSCHLSSNTADAVSDHPGAPCPRAMKDCVACHMPKYEVPDTHTEFTDHWIRIVRSNRTPVE